MRNPRRRGLALAALALGLAATALLPGSAVATTQTQTTTACTAKAAPGAPATSSARNQQVMILHYVSGVKGTYNRYQWSPTGCRWIKKGSATAVFGYNGVIAAARRVQGDGKTPEGRWPVMSVFGQGNPGTNEPYTKINNTQWWDERSSSPTYNRMISGPHGCNLGDCEHLINDTTAGGGYLYNQAIVFAFNPPGPNQHRSGGGSGAGIFFHYAHEYTTGCVAITNYAQLVATVKWLNTTQHPLVVIN